MATITNIALNINLVAVPFIEWATLMEGLVQSTCPITQSNTVNIPLFGDIDITLTSDLSGNTVKVRYVDREYVARGIILGMSNATGELNAYQFSDVFDEGGAQTIPINLTNGETDDILNMHLLKMLVEHPII